MEGGRTGTERGFVVVPFIPNVSDKLYYAQLSPKELEDHKWIIPSNGRLTRGFKVIS